MNIKFKLPINGSVRRGIIAAVVFIIIGSNCTPTAITGKSTSGLITQKKHFAPRTEHVTREIGAPIRSILQSLLGLKPDPADSLAENRLIGTKAELARIGVEVYHEEFTYLDESDNITEYIYFYVSGHKHIPMFKTKVVYDNLKRRTALENYEVYPKNKLLPTSAIRISYLAGSDNPNKLEYFQKRHLERVITVEYDALSSMIKMDSLIIETADDGSGEIYESTENVFSALYDTQHRMLSLRIEEDTHEWSYSTEGQIIRYQHKRGRVHLQQFAMELYPDSERIKTISNTVFNHLQDIDTKWTVSFSISGRVESLVHTYRDDFSKSIWGKLKTDATNIPIEAKIKYDMFMDDIHAPVPEIPLLINPLYDSSWYPWVELNEHDTGN